MWNTTGCPDTKGLMATKKPTEQRKKQRQPHFREGLKKLPKEENFTSLAHLHRKTKETKTKETRKWLEQSLEERQNCTLPTTKNPDPKAIKAPKRLTTRSYQLKIGHAVIGSHLKRINPIEDDRCWWCRDGERQTVGHLLKFCKRWRRQREELAKKIKKNLWYHIDLGHMFQDITSTERILEFLKSTEVRNRMKEKEREERDEERDAENGGEGLMEHLWEDEEDWKEKTKKKN